MHSTEEFDAYLSAPGVPDFVKMPTHFPGYKEVPMGEEDDEDTERKKNLDYGIYQKYYNNLNYDRQLYNSNSKSATNKYYKNHRVYQPSNLVGGTDDQIVRGTFDSYLDLPTVFSSRDLTGAAYHCGVSPSKGDYYLVGGIGVMRKKNYEALLRKVTYNFQIPARNIKMKFEGELPPCVSKDKLMLLACVPNRKIYKYTTDSRTFSVLADYRKEDYTGQLLCSAAVAVSATTFMVCGGFQLRTDYNYVDETHLNITRRIELRGDIFLCDISTRTLKILTLTVVPPYRSLTQEAIPRFGHSLVAVTLEQNNNRPKNEINPLPFTKPAIVFMMGGYRFCNDGKSLLAMNDLWKLEIMPTSQGISTEVTSCPIGNFKLVGDRYSLVMNEEGEFLHPEFHSSEFIGLMNHNIDDSWPLPRAFFGMALVDRPGFLRKSLDDLESLVTPTPWSSGRSPSPEPSGRSLDPLSVGARNLEQRAAHTSHIDYLKSKVLMVHGGIWEAYIKVVSKGGESYHFSKRALMGDMWWFDFAEESWHHLKTGRSGGTNLPFDLKVCGHQLVATKNRLLVVNGLMSTQIPLEWSQTRSEDKGDKALSEQAFRCRRTLDDIFIQYMHRQPSCTFVKNGIDRVGAGLASYKGVTLMTRMFYRSYILSLDTCKWNRLEFLLIPRVRSKRLPAEHGIFVGSPVVVTDSKLIVVGGDIRMLNAATEECLKSAQSDFNDAILEFYTPYLKI